MTTFRHAVRDALEATANSYQAANPTLLKRVYRRRPKSFRDLPCAYLGKLTEVITHDGGTRTRVATGSLILVDRLTDEGETLGRLDDLADGVLDYLTAAVRAVATYLPGAGPMSPTSIEPDEVEVGGAIYELEAFGIRAELSEGRA